MTADPYLLVIASARDRVEEIESFWSKPNVDPHDAKRFLELARRIRQAIAVVDKERPLATGDRVTGEYVGRKGHATVVELYGEYARVRWDNEHDIVFAYVGPSDRIGRVSE